MIQALIPLIGKVLDVVIPDPEKAAEAKLRTLELAQRGELAVLDADMKLALAQIEVNKAEAESDDPYKSRWRPSVGWVCVFALGYNFLLQPLLPWIVALFGVSVPPLPAIDNEALMGILIPLLGIGGFRTYEKVKGKA